MKTNYKISGVVPTYNSWQTLKECLQSLASQSCDISEIIVVDNASTDGTYKNLLNLAKISKTLSSKLKIVRNPINEGVTGGRNRGIKEMDKRSELILFFDHDMVADKEMLANLIKTIDKQDFIGIVTPKIYYWEKKKHIWSAGTDINLWTGQVIFRGGKDIGQYNKEEKVQVAPASMLVKKEVLRKVEGFDTSYFATYEDTDFCFRARQKGFETFYSPKAIAYHKIPFNEKTSNIRLLERSYLVGRNRVIFMKKFGKSFPIFLLFLPVFFLYYLSLAIKYRKPVAVLKFLQGSFSGLLS